MGIDTQGCVVTKEKDVFKVAQVIQGWWYNLTVAHKLTWCDYEGDVPQWEHLKLELRPGWSALNAFFKYKGQERRFFINFDCDSDLSIYKDEIKGESCIWFSLGCWGSSVELMRSLMEAFKAEEWADGCYIDENDCDEEGFIQV